MAETFGDFIDVSPAADSEYLNLSFSPSSVPLKQRWRNNGLSADFLGDYVTTFFPKDAADPATGQRQAEIRGAVAYIANELLENSMKYSDDSLGAPIAITLYLNRDQLLFAASNGITAEQRGLFQAFIEELEAGDPNELYLQRLEAQAMSDNGAGLGYLTMINDYGATLAWRFGEDAAGRPLVTTQVRLAI